MSTRPRGLPVMVATAPLTRYSADRQASRFHPVRGWLHDLVIGIAVGGWAAELPIHWFGVHHWDHFPTVHSLHKSRLEWIAHHL
jgi:hypothetical protein